MQNIMHNTLVVLLLLDNSILYTPSSSTLSCCAHYYSCFYIPTWPLLLTDESTMSCQCTSRYRRDGARAPFFRSNVRMMARPSPSKSSATLMRKQMLGHDIGTTLTGLHRDYRAFGSPTSPSLNSIRRRPRMWSEHAAAICTAMFRSS